MIVTERDPRMTHFPPRRSARYATSEVRWTKPLYAAVGLAERLLCRLAAGVLPWSQRSQHEAWISGQVDGLAQGAQRRADLLAEVARLRRRLVEAETVRR